MSFEPVFRFLLITTLLLILLFRLPSAVPSPRDAPAPEALQLAMPHALAAQVTASGQLPALEQRLGQPVEILSYQPGNETAELFSLCNKPDFGGILSFRTPSPSSRCRSRVF